MARIPEHEIERLKQTVSLERLVEAQGIALKRHGKNLLGRCPFHDDKTPSLVVTPDTNLWHCLGACQSGGSVIDWVMKSQGVSFRHAVELLKADQPGSTVQPAQRSTTKKLPTPLTSDAEDQALLMQVVDYYHETLKNDAEGLAYLEKRGISREAMEHFKLGLSNRTLGYRLPEKNRKDGAAIRGHLQSLGVLRKTGHEHFAGSVVVPIINENQVLELYGRKIGERLRKGTPLHLYLPGPHQGVFNLEALAVSKEIILCESLIDALTFWSAGFRNVTTSYGVEGFTDDLLKAFKENKTERVLIAYDRDEAGEKAATSLAAQLMESGIDCYRVNFPKGMDANEFAVQVTPAHKSLGTAIRGAVWMGNGTPPERQLDVEMQTGSPGVEVELKKTPVLQAESNQEKNETPLEDAPQTVPESQTTFDLGEELEALPAAVIPEAPQQDIPAEIKQDDIIISLAARRYRIRGLRNNTTPSQLKINLLASQGDADVQGCTNIAGAGSTGAMHVDTFDLYSAKSRYSFIKQTAIELGVSEEVIKKDLGKVLLKCEALQEENLEKTQENKASTKNIDDAERLEALALLKDKNLLERILADFNTAGVVGEETNKLVGYLAAVSRKLDKPLAVIIQSTSAAGKSSLMDAVLAMMPEEERVQFSAMTGQSLFYMGETNLKNKILAIAEEEGAQSASYALKLLQSEGELTIASTGKDDNSGTLVTREYHVEGPVMLFLTTTAIDIDEELMNRCLVLTVNESREQTRAIHAMQRKAQTLEGLLQAEDKKHLIRLHRNAQRLLRPLLVANPFAEQLSFIDDKTRTRRDHMKYLTLIKSIALLHQYQREVKTINHNNEVLEYIEVTPKDIETANRLAHEVLGRSLDELPPQTCNLLKHIQAMVKAACESQKMDRCDYRFSRRDVRQSIGWTDFQIKKHMGRLQEMEYVLVHRGRRGQSFVYELLYNGEGEDGKAFLLGLADMEKLGAVPAHPCTHGTSASCTSYDEKKEPPKEKKAPPSSPQVAPKEPTGSTEENTPKPQQDKALSEAEPQTRRNTPIKGKTSASHRTPPLAATGH